MKQVACTVRTRTKWLALLTVCGMALTASAHAQGQQQTVLAVPTQAFGQIAAQAAIHQQNVTLIALSQFAAGAGNSNVAVIGVSNKNRARVSKLWLPKWALPSIKQMNSTAVLVEQTAIGAGNANVAQVDVVNANTVSLPRGTKTFWCPAWAAPSVLQVNSTTIVVTQVAIGTGNSNVALIGVFNANKVKVPKSALPSVAQLNSTNIQVDQTSIGHGNTNYAEIIVGNNNSVR